MRNAFWLFVAALVVVVLAGTALAESDTAYECTNPNGSTFTVEDPAECDISETPPTWAVGANGSTSFRVVETTYVMLGTDTVELFPYKAECDVEEQVINGGLYWDDVSMRFLTGDRGPVGTGRIVGNAWQELVVGGAAPPDLHEWSMFTVFAVCAG